MNLFNKSKFLLVSAVLALCLNCAADSQNTETVDQTGAKATDERTGKISSNEFGADENSSNKTENISNSEKLSPAKSGEIESIYTDLSDKKCKTIESTSEGGGSYRGDCGGVGSYKIELTEGDLRQSINIISNSGEEWALDFPQIVSSAFSAFGEKAEWRVKKVGGKTIPFALITRYNVADSPEKPEKNTSYLVVTKISGEFVCITDIVKPIPDANVKARELADNSAGKPCLKAK